jgi:phosphoenolpyruvate carboxykinase (GTP)
MRFLNWVHEVETLTSPENIFWCDGSEAERDFLVGEALRQGVLLKLNQQRNPGCYLHRSNPNDVARVEQFTLICTPTKEEAGPTNHWTEPRGDLQQTARNAQGRDARPDHVRRALHHGTAGAPLTKVGFEITDSIYVVLSMRIMTRMGASPMSARPDRRPNSIACAFAPRCESGAALDLPFPAGQHHHLGRVRLRRQRSS